MSYEQVLQPTVCVPDASCINLAKAMASHAVTALDADELYRLGHADGYFDMVDPRYKDNPHYKEGVVMGYRLRDASLEAGHVPVAIHRPMKYWSEADSTQEISGEEGGLLEF